MPGRHSSEVFLSPGDERVQKAILSFPVGGKGAEQNFKMKTVQLIFNIFILSYAAKHVHSSNMNHEIIAKGIVKEILNIKKKGGFMSTPSQITSLNPH